MGLPVDPSNPNWPRHLCVNPALTPRQPHANQNPIGVRPKMRSKCHRRGQKSFFQLLFVFFFRPWFLTSFGTHFKLQNGQQINLFLHFFYLKFQLRKSMKIDYQISFFLLISLLSEKCDITDSSLPAVYYWCRHHNIISSWSTTMILI